jgi:hypothetical protein
MGWQDHHLEGQAGALRWAHHGGDLRQGQEGPQQAHEVHPVPLRHGPLRGEEQLFCSMNLAQYRQHMMCPAVQKGAFTQAHNFNTQGSWRVCAPERESVQLGRVSAISAGSSVVAVALFSDPAFAHTPRTKFYSLNPAFVTQHLCSNYQHLHIFMYADV